MKFSREYFIDGAQTPYESLEKAESKSKKLGSTTALVAYYQEGLKLLDVSQVGDCNLIVIRGNYVVHQLILKFVTTMHLIKSARVLMIL